MPISPHAWSPDAGPTICTPSARSVSTLRCVAAFCHISTFIAGATSSGQRRARHSVESRSSAQAVRELGHEVGGRRRDEDQLAVARQLDVRHGVVDARVPQVGPHRLSGQRLHRRGVMKRVAASVIATRTSAPAFTSRRASSAAL